MNRAYNNNSMAAILIFNFAKVITITIDMFGFCYKRFCSDYSPTKLLLLRGGIFSHIDILLVLHLKILT